jgi:hypothetical protein
MNEYFEVQSLPEKSADYGYLCGLMQKRSACCVSWPEGSRVAAGAHRALSVQRTRRTAAA